MYKLAIFRNDETVCKNSLLSFMMPSHLTSLKNKVALFSKRICLDF